ncbi:hypothetical protein [Helicobacter saguini]|nr:hypothetical protein [Helicobacter saguini]
MKREQCKEDAQSVINKYATAAAGVCASPKNLKHLVLLAKC